jgi:hypothetical protein
MPAYHRLGSNDHKSELLFWPQPPGNNPEQPIKASDPRSRPSSLQGQKLLAQGQILQQEITTRVEKSPEQTQQEPKHDTCISDVPVSLICENC